MFSSYSIYWMMIFILTLKALVRLRVINEPSFIEYWMFKFGSTTNIKCSNLTWAWAQLGLAWFIIQAEPKLNIKFMRSRSNTSILSNLYQVYYDYQAYLVWTINLNAQLTKGLVIYELIVQTHVKLITKYINQPKLDLFLF